LLVAIAFLDRSYPELEHGSDAAHAHRTGAGDRSQVLAREAIERLVDYDDWFVREVEKGLDIFYRFSRAG
jgi:hypothetical protein